MLPETAQYRRSNEALRALVARQLLAVWPTLEPADLDESFPAWLQLVAVIVGRGRVAASSLAGGYLSQFGEDSPAAPDDLPPAQFARAAQGSVISAKQAIGAGKTVEEAMQIAYVRSLGEASKLVLDAGRSTIINTTAASEKFSGWRRVTAGSSCAFCRMLAGRGAVYRDEARSHFASHPHCMCSVEPVSRTGMALGQRQEVTEYQRSERRFSDADRARVRAWIKANNP